MHCVHKMALIELWGRKTVTWGMTAVITVRKLAFVLL